MQGQTKLTAHAHAELLENHGVPLNADELQAVAATLDPFDHTPEGRARRQEIFLLALQEFGTIKAGCRMVNISRQTYFEWISNFPEFKIAVEHSFMDVADDLEEEVFRRGKDKSDPLLMFAVKRFKPEYRDSYSPNAGADDELHAEKLRAAKGMLTSKIKTLVERREANLALPPAGSEPEVDDDKIEKPAQLRRVKKKKW